MDARTLLPPRQDVALAAVLVVLELAGAGQDSGRSAADVAVALPLPVTIAFRRSAPTLAAAAFLASAVVAALLDLHPVNSAATVIAVVVGTYSTAAYLPPRRAGATLLLWFASTAVDTVAGRQDVADAIFGCVVLTCAFVPGLVVRRQRAQAEAAQRSAATFAQEARQAVAVERARIARELHDVVAHAVSIMVVQAAAADEVLDRDPQRAHVALGAVQRSGRAAVVELGRMLDLLRSDDEALAPLPTLEGLPALVADARRSGLDVALHDETPGRYPAAIELCAYRVVQEGVTNALRHAPGSRVAVRLAQCGDALEVWVENSAAAVPSPAPAGTGHGLIGLRERVTVFGGRLDAGPRPEGGYRVRASVPLGAVP